SDAARSRRIEIPAQGRVVPRELQIPTPHRTPVGRGFRSSPNRAAPSRPPSATRLFYRFPTRRAERGFRAPEAGRIQRAISAPCLTVFLSFLRLDQACRLTPKRSAIKSINPTNPTSITESAEIRSKAPVPHRETIKEPITSVPGPSRYTPVEYSRTNIMKIKS